MKVSIITTSYNHGAMLDRAIRSVEWQSFQNYEHFILDDTETKIGMMRNYKKGFELCKGQYIAMCDGDDYWCDPDKLKKQVEFMDNNPDVGLCLTKVYTEENGKRSTMGVSADYINKNMSFDSLLKGNAYIYAPSYLIRKADFDLFVSFDEYMKFNVWDYPIVLELIQSVRFHCMDFYGSVFTKNAESVTQTRSRNKRFKYVMGNYKIKLHFMLAYPFKASTLLYLIYRFTRDIYSIIFKRWQK